MSNMNLVILMGRLGKDPELSYTQSGTPRCKFSMATSKRRSDGQGGYTEKTEWHRIVVWGKQAENSNKFLGRGDLVLLEGELTYHTFEDSKTGQKVTYSEVNAHRVTFMPKSMKGGGGRPQGGAPSEDQGGGDQGGGDKQGSGGDYPDDIPF